MNSGAKGRIVTLAKEHPYVLSGVICILFWLLTGGSVSFLNKAGITAKTCMIVYLALFGAVIVTGVVLKIRKKLNTSGYIALIAIGGVLARIWFAMYSLTNDAYQHDFGNFDRNPLHAVHDNYIFYIFDNWRLPDFDFRGYGQYYHPPLHHFISAVAMKINEVVFPGREGNYEFLMCISLFYSLVIMILLYKILKLFKFDGVQLICAFALVSFYPFMIVSAGQINNDPLASLFFIAAFYHAILWYREPGFRRIITVAVCIGCAMMSKISAGLIAVPVGFIFLVMLIKKKFRDSRLWLQFLSFAAVVFPLGLWFPIRNYINWKIPPTYVFDLGILPRQDMTVFTPLERLFGLSEVTVTIPFVIFGEDYRDYNIFMILFKSSLFDDFDHHDKELYILLATFMFFLGAAIVAMIIAGLVLMIRRIIREKDPELAAVVLLLVTELASSILFAFKYPLICSVSFRYIFPTVICFTLCMAFCFTKSKNEVVNLLQKIAIGAIACFSLVTVAFYACEWMAMPFY